MAEQSLYHTFHRYRTLQTHRVSALPIVILMPHSACNCQCVMCDIWKGNRNLKQLTEADIENLLGALRNFGTQQILMSGGEALLHPNFFRLCEILKKQAIRITVLSTGLTLERNAEKLLQYTDELIISLDGDEELHNRIRNIPGAFQKTRQGVQLLKTLDPGYRITARTVIHKLNYRQWPAIIEAALEMGLDQISFLPADTSSHAFNRAILWEKERQEEILPTETELDSMQSILDGILVNYQPLFAGGFIAEPALKLQKIIDHYHAVYGHNAYPYKKCNAPWVSAVIEADGTVRPCFFHEAMGNIKEHPLDAIINSKESIRFRKELDVQQNPTCQQCVCYLNLPPRSAIN
ncbi:MAG: radical SAM protein [Bacteroidota bacterium]